MYGTLQMVTQAFPAAQWDPTKPGHEPGAAAVEAWLEQWSTVLDGQIMTVVQTPVNPTLSPSLHAVCAQITALRVRADVYDAKWPPKASDPAGTRQSMVWRGQADDLIKGIQRGSTGDGRPAVADRVATALPVGDFGTGASFAQRDRQW